MRFSSAALVAGFTASQLVSAAVIERQASTISTIPTVMWTALNMTVSGRLRRGEPFARPCYASTASGTGGVASATECQARKDNMREERYRIDQFGSAIMTQWESCPAENSYCLINNISPFDATPFSGQCGQGSIAPYYIIVKQATDVMAAFMFSKMTGVPITIKNKGHDFAGRSHGKDSLSLWTHNLQDITRNKLFVPEGCPSSTAAQDAAIVGAGIYWEKAYQWAEAEHVTLLGGSCPTVGGGGGWIQGGGHGALSNTLGLGVDRVLQFKVVTPDGTLRIANKCQNTDLFWAMRGGGAGTWGVALEVVYKLDPQITLQTYNVDFSANATTERIRAFTEIMVNNGIKIAEDGWGGYLDATSLKVVTPKLNRTQAQLSLKPIIDYMASLGGIVSGTNDIVTMYSWYEFESKVAGPNAEQIPGWIGGTAGRFIQKPNFATAASRAALVDALISVYEHSTAVSIMLAGPYNYKYEVGATSVHPGWRSTVWFALSIGLLWDWNIDAAGLKAKYTELSQTVDVLRAITQFPDGGTYISEADLYEPDWENAYFGSNYPKLLEIKKKYDPNSLLDCWKCVGWKGPKDPRYKCYV